MTDDPYSDPVTGVLYNRFGIADAAELRRVEADLSYGAIVDLGGRALPGDYDLVHLQAFHREIFGDIYPAVRKGRSSTNSLGRPDGRSTGPCSIPRSIQLPRLPRCVATTRHRECFWDGLVVH